MERRRNGGTPAVALALGLLLSLGLGGEARAGTSGKLSGKVTNEKKEPLTGANVIVLGMRLGAATDADGRFTILNIPAGRISVKAALLGHQPVVVENVEIAADNTTRLDIELKVAAVQMKEVVVSARRPVIEVNRTSNMASVSREQLQALPVQELQDIVNLQAGVVDGHFRGGRKEEVQYQVDGVTVNNAYDNTSTLRLDRSLLEEVQVISGTFDAEYGQAMSGVVNAVLKRGTDTFHWDAEVYSGGPFYPGNDHRSLAYWLRPAAQQNFQVSMNGPTLLPRTTYLLSARHGVSDDWVYGTQRFRPGDPNENDSLFVLRPSGDNGRVSIGYSHEWSGVLKVTHRGFKNVELSYQAIGNLTDARKTNWAYRLIPDAMTTQRTISFVQGMDLTHTLSTTRFYTLSARQNYYDYRDWAFENPFDPRYDLYGKTISVPEYEYGALFQGVDFTRFKQKTNGAVLKGSYVDQLDRDHQLKVGAEFQAPHVAFGKPVELLFQTDSLSGGAQRLKRFTTYSPEHPGVQEYRPFIGAAFAQEEVEWNDLTLRAGARLDYFNARSSIPSDLANPADSIAGAPHSFLRRVGAKVAIQPRIGVSYPITDKAALFFAYGHFYQFPGLGQVFDNADYRVLGHLQAGDVLRVMGNPDIRPERTVQYQFGYKHAISEWVGLDLTAFYKDIRDLLGVELIETYNGAQYGRLTNVDFGSVIGFTITLRQRAKGAFSSTIDYTWQSAQGNSSDPNETATRASAGEDPRPRSVPFDWDQRHTLNMTLQLARPKAYSLSAIVKLASGQPYTPAITTGFNSGLEKNSGHKPTAMLVDLRGEKSVRLLGLSSTAFARVFNVFDTRYFNGFVFTNSGSPYYSSSLAFSELGQLADPTHFFAPRRVELGLTLNVAN